MSTTKEVPFVDREKRVEIRPYEFHLHIVVSNDFSRSMNNRKLRIEGELGNPYAFVWILPGCSDIFAFLPERCGLGATAHEMMHVVSFVMRESGVRFSRESEEVWCYHLGELTQIAAEFVHTKDPKKYRKQRPK